MKKLLFNAELKAFRYHEIHKMILLLSEEVIFAFSVLINLK